jgi:hypothetical protein
MDASNGLAATRLMIVPMVLSNAKEMDKVGVGTLSVR